MKQGWEIKKIGDICDIKTGKLDANASSENGQYPFFTCSVEPLKIDYYAYDCECVLIAGNGDLNVKYYNGKFNAYQRTYIITTKTEVKNICVKYLYKFFSAYIEQLRKLSIGSVIKYIKLGNLTDAVILIPSLEEQERIVEVLDREFEKIDAMKANAEQNLQHAKDLFQAALRQELQPKEGWVKYKLQDVCTEYGDYGMSLPSKPYNGIRYLRITDITEWGELNNDFVSADTDEVEDRYMLRDGDVLFARTGATVGKTLVYNENMGTCSYAGYLIRYRLNQEIILPSIMYYITHSKWYYEWITANQKSATLPNISAKLYNSYEIDIPSTLLEQEQIVARLDILNERCKALEENYKKTIALCDDMKQALLRKAFNGEL